MGCKLMTSLQTGLLGALAMGLFTSSVFFFRFWARTRDIFFLFFAISLLIEACSRIALASIKAGDESEPLFYLPRLVAFGLIVLAVALKNRPDKSE
jgi:hypothetical protein